MVTEESKASIYNLKLKGREVVAERTLEFRFAKPSGMVFEAGQFMDLTLIDPPETDSEGNTRAFSINDAPNDSDLTFTTRLRDSAFKRVLQTMPLGTEVKLEGPFGGFTLHNNVKKRAVLLAGGIGITPFLSIIRRATHEKLPHQIILFYANRRPEDAAFLNEFQDLARRNSNFTFVPTMTEMEKSKKSWEGNTGHITYDLVSKSIQSNGQEGQNMESIYYMAGPAGMVTSLKTMLVQAGVDSDDIRTEEFSGY